MILSEHTLKGNGNKLVYEFLSTLEPASSWLDFVSVVHEVGIQESNASAVQGTG